MRQQRSAGAEGLAGEGGPVIYRGIIERDIENKYLHFSSPRFPTYSLAIAPSDLQFYVDMARQMKMINNPIDPAKLIAP